MKKAITLLLTFMFVFGCLSGCAGGSPLNTKEPVTLTMWHNYGGDMQQAMDYLIDQFNSTVGKEQGIIIDVTAISSSSELNKSLAMIVNGDPGAPDMPDIFTGYPKLAIQFWEKGMLADLGNYFNEQELSAYVDAFVEEGRLSDGGLYVFPIAKSTEVLYVNQTLFDRFAADTGASADMLSTFEGLAELSEMYYEWSGGKQFYAADSWFNFAEVGMAQLGDSIFEGEALSLEGDNFAHIFKTVYAPAVEGGIAIYDGYSSDLSKTGDMSALPVLLRVSCSMATPSLIQTERLKMSSTVSFLIPCLKTEQSLQYSAAAVLWLPNLMKRKNMPPAFSSNGLLHPSRI
ncbi:MAG: extracellular solute-binding protein [Oscillospiraceae bacterium]|nr:extracellular solute-binding protein [Oscillospiraceae bacterium]